MTTAGFVPNVEQSEASLVGIRLLFAGLPCAGFLIGAWLFRGFSLDGEGPPAILAAPVPAPSRLD